MTVAIRYANRNRIVILPKSIEYGGWAEKFSSALNLLNISSIMVQKPIAVMKKQINGNSLKNGLLRQERDFVIFSKFFFQKVAGREMPLPKPLLWLSFFIVFNKTSCTEQDSGISYPKNKLDKKSRRESDTFSVLYLGRESNPNLIFRRDLFYPLNYQGFYGSLYSVEQKPLVFTPRRYNNYSQTSNDRISF